MRAPQRLAALWLLPSRWPSHGALASLAAAPAAAPAAAAAAAAAAGRCPGGRMLAQFRSPRARTHLALPPLLHVVPARVGGEGSGRGSCWPGRRAPLGECAAWLNLPPPAPAAGTHIVFRASPRTLMRTMAGSQGNTGLCCKKGGEEGACRFGASRMGCACGGALLPLRRHPRGAACSAAWVEV